MGEQVGRRARRRRGLRHVLTWTTVGALLPGTNFVAAGHRRVGGVLLAALFLVTATLAALAAGGALTWVGLRVAVRPGALLLAAAAVLLAGVVWAGVVVAGHVALRRGTDLTRGQRGISALVVLALVALTIAPAGVAARYALAQRTLLQDVFADGDTGTPRDPALAAPDVEAEDPWAGVDRVNVLLVGSDAGPHVRGTRPDTLITASVDPRTGDTVLLSLPRNLERAPFPAGTPGHARFPEGFWCPGSQECLLNGVWTWAQNNPSLFPNDPNPGLTATRQVVGETLGLTIDYHAVVNLAGFVELVDALGGVRIDVPRPVPFGMQVIPAGPQVLDGADALAYTRSRDGSSDYGRMERQRCFIGALIDQVDAGVLARSFPRVAAAAGHNIRTDVRVGEIGAFIELASRMQAGETSTLAFTNEVISSANPDLDLIRNSVRSALGAGEDHPVVTATAAVRDGLGSLAAPAVWAVGGGVATAQTAVPVAGVAPVQPVGDACA